jgi:hypothetical protein
MTKEFFGQFPCSETCIFGGEGGCLAVGWGWVVCWGQRGRDNKTLDRTGSRHVESWSCTESVFHTALAVNAMERLQHKLATDELIPPLQKIKEMATVLPPGESPTQPIPKTHTDTKATKTVSE